MTQKERLRVILSRFVRESDKLLSDEAFIITVFDRFMESRQRPIIDPND